MTTPAVHPTPHLAEPHPTQAGHGLAAAIDDLLGGAVLDGIFGQMEWAGEEIERARARHPTQDDRIHHSFSLLTPTHDRMATEFVYRSHCAEVLERVAAGADTRPGTAAELCCAMRDVSLLSPLTSAATGLYMRMWRVAGFPEIEHFTAAAQHHEALERSTIDDHERFARRKVVADERRLGDIVCQGFHHGEPVSCRYTRAQLALAI